MTRLILIVGLLLLHLGCFFEGYQVIRSDQLLGHNKIAIAPVQEPSVIGIATLLTRHLEQRLLHHGLTLVPDDSSAPLRLLIELKNPRTTTTAISSIDKGSPTYRESLTLLASLIDPATGETHWKAQISQAELFRQETSGDTAILTEAGRRRAMDRLARRFALELSNRMLVASLATSEGE